jgi:HEAT repeat protein
MGEVNEQLEIVRSGMPPLDYYRDRTNRAKSFDDRLSEHFRIVLTAIYKLGELKDQRAVLTLVRVLEDTLWGTPKRGFSSTQKLLLQQAAAESLGQIGGTAALTKLNDLLKSKDPKERLMAGRAFAGATGSQAVTDLLTALKKEKDAAIKAQLMSALGKVGRASGNRKEKELIVKELIGEMEKGPQDIQIAAVNALGAVALKSATEALMKLARQHLGIAPLVSDVARALGEIRDDRAVELLAILLKDHGSESVRREAALALGKIRGPKALTALKSRRSKEKDARVRAAISTAIHGEPAVLKWAFP